MYKPVIANAWLLILGLLSPAAFAAEDSKSLKATNATAQTPSAREPITITADRLISNTHSGQSEYRGAVQLTYGKLTLKGDTLIIEHPDGKLLTATMLGKPASARNYLPQKQQWLTGKAQSITFDQVKDTITLSDHASLVLDNGNSLEAQRITLHLKDETFAASGGTDNKGRVQMIIRSED